MKLIKLHESRVPNVVWVNPAQIAEVREASGGSLVCLMGQGDGIVVRETPAEIADAFEFATRPTGGVS